jgi:hypothetical protein
MSQLRYRGVSVIARSGRRFAPALLSAFVVLTAAMILHRSVERTRFHGDESGWIASGLYYSELVLTRDFSWEKWNCPGCSNWGSLNPPVGKLMVGIPLTMHSRAHASDIERDFRGYYNFDVPFEQNVAEGRVPSAPTLLRARRTSAALGVLCCLLIFYIAYRADSYWTAIAAAALLLMNALFVESASRAMTDVHYSTFLLLLCAASLFVLQARARTHVLWGSAVCGVLTGLSCSVKVTGVLIGGCYFLALTAYKFWIDGMGRVWLLSSLSFIGSSVVIIYALNPYYWPAPADMGVRAVVAEIRAVPDALGNKTLQSEDHFPHLSRLLAFPLLFRRWQAVMALQQSRLSANWNGSRSLAIHRELMFNNVSFRGETIFFLIGVVVCGIKIRDSLAERRVHPLAVPMMYFGVNYLFILFFLQLNWARYYLPTVIASRIIIAVGVVHVAALGIRMLRRAEGKSPPTRPHGQARMCRTATRA